jgi:hypothetical protein
MQIAGSKCERCGHKVILSSEGKSCAQCKTVMHFTCEPASVCEVCGQLFEGYEAAKPDPLGDGLLPPALRPARSGGPALAILVGGGLALLGIIIWLELEYMAARGGK